MSVSISGVLDQNWSPNEHFELNPWLHQKRTSKVIKSQCLTPWFHQWNVLVDKMIWKWAIRVKMLSNLSPRIYQRVDCQIQTVRFHSSDAVSDQVKVVQQRKRFSLCKMRIWLLQEVWHKVLLLLMLMLQQMVLILMKLFLILTAE